MTKGAIVRNQRRGDSYRIRLSKPRLCRCSFRYLMRSLWCHKDTILIYSQPQSYVFIGYKVVCAEFLGSVFSSKLSIVPIDDTLYRRDA